MCKYATECAYIHACVCGCVRLCINSRLHMRVRVHMRGCMHDECVRAHECECATVVRESITTHKLHNKHSKILKIAKDQLFYILFNSQE